MTKKCEESQAVVLNKSIPVYCTAAPAGGHSSGNNVVCIILLVR